MRNHPISRYDKKIYPVVGMWVGRIAEATDQGFLHSYLNFFPYPFNLVGVTFYDKKQSCGWHVGGL